MIAGGRFEFFLDSGGRKLALYKTRVSSGVPEGSELGGLAK